MNDRDRESRVFEWVLMLSGVALVVLWALFLAALFVQVTS